VQPSGIPDIGATLTHWATGDVDIDTGDCIPNCPYQHQLLAAGDIAPLDVTGPHPVAAQARAFRLPMSRPRRRWWARILQRTTRATDA
jgi:hypothetical protein